MGKKDHNYCVNMNYYHEVFSKYKRQNIIENKYMKLILLKIKMCEQRWFRWDENIRKIIYYYLFEFL